MVKQIGTNQIQDLEILQKIGTLRLGIEAEVSIKH